MLEKKSRIHKENAGKDIRKENDMVTIEEETRRGGEPAEKDR